MKTTHWLILGAIAVVGVVVWLTFRVNRVAANVDKKIQPAQPRPNPFGNGVDPAPPLGTSNISGRPGAPVSPIPGSVGAVLNEVQTGADAAATIAKDLKTTVGYIKDLFN